MMSIPSPVPRGSSTLYDFGVGVGILAAAGERPNRGQGVQTPWGRGPGGSPLGGTPQGGYPPGGVPPSYQRHIFSEKCQNKMHLTGHDP